jgi:protein-S-isoprenylcysteine O-methyltransferase Ste14
MDLKGVPIMTALKSTLFFIFVPCLLLGVLPYWLMLNTTAILDLGTWRWTAILLWFNGIWMMLWCFYDFTFKGRGTPAPIDPPKELVVSGLYRFMRNPMYFGGITILLGHAIWWPSFSLLMAPLLFLLATHLFVVFYEEPTLRKKFGAAYEQYCCDVPRWGRLFGKRI